MRSGRSTSRTLGRSSVPRWAARFILALCLVLIACGSLRADESQIQRGKYLVTAADCFACHTDPKTQIPYAGGRGVRTPFGTVISANITPDLETGIGRWTDQQFDQAVRYGKRVDGAHLYPAMPYPYYRKLTREQVQDMRAYLNTVPAVRQQRPPNTLPFPFNIRLMLVFWNAFFFHDQPFTPIAAQSAEWNRGAWLVQGPGHCAACHTPKNILGGDKRDAPLQGYALQGWVAPDITRNVNRGLAHWTSEDMRAFLRSGHNTSAAAGGPMKEVVEDSTSQLSDADLQAMTVYLGSFASNATLPAAVSPEDPAMQAGAAIFGDLCSACHTHRGSGVPYVFPDLAVSPAVAARDSDGVVHVLLHGAQSAATQAEPTGPAMPSYGEFLTDEQLAAVATYVRNSWGHAAKPTSVGEIRKARQHPEG